MQGHGFEQPGWDDLIDGDLCLVHNGIEVATSINTRRSLTEI